MQPFRMLANAAEAIISALADFWPLSMRHRTRDEALSVCEDLEPRFLKSAFAFNSTTGALTVTGSNDNETVDIYANSNGLHGKYADNTTGATPEPWDQPVGTSRRAPQ